MLAGGWLQECAIATVLVMLSGSRVAGDIEIRPGGFEHNEICKTGQHMSTKAGRIQHVSPGVFVGHSANKDFRSQMLGALCGHLGLCCSFLLPAIWALLSWRGI